MSHIQARCDFFNALQPNMEVTLSRGQYLALTYGSNLRLGDNDGNGDFLTLRTPPEKVLVDADSPIDLILYHGRDQKDQDMEDWGYSCEEKPRAQAFVITEEGLKLVNFSPKSETLIPFVEGLLEYKGKYYGDFCLEVKDPEVRDDSVPAACPAQ